ncbi:MAG: membrane integrity-associated transporter subunit PqiC [Deltaproteobacteria bacterium]|jgi:uncharacterized lipoprotein YmbA|nr:membrane integrity-associated transporter subunit PqiC [Deltaproteobacteria bacterium]
MVPNNFKLTIGILLAVALMFSSCLSGGPSRTPATRFYVLNSLYSAENKAELTPVAVLKDVAIGVGPVKLSQVLDRPQIILRTSHNEIRVADLDRWAAPLNENITNVLVDNLSALLATGNILKFPWKARIPIDYQIVMDITRFDGMPGENVDLRARWGILNTNDSNILSKGNSVLTEPIGENSIPAMVSAQSRLLAKLSREIAAEIKKLEENKAKQ